MRECRFQGEVVDVAVKGSARPTVLAVNPSFLLLSLLFVPSANTTMLSSTTHRPPSKCAATLWVSNICVGLMRIPPLGSNSTSCLAETEHVKPAAWSLALFVHRTSVKSLPTLHWVANENTNLKTEDEVRKSPGWRNSVPLLHAPPASPSRPPSPMPMSPETQPSPLPHTGRNCLKLRSYCRIA